MAKHTDVSLAHKILIWGIVIFVGFIVAIVFDGCVKIGEGHSVRTYEIEIPVYNKNYVFDAPKTLWIDTGMKVSSDLQSEIKVSGSIDLCPGECSANSIKCREILLDAAMCQGGYPPSYSQFQDNIDPGIVCAEHGQRFDANGYYTNTNLKVSPGDRVTFSLVPTTIEINSCSDLKDLGVTVYNSGELVDSSGEILKDVNGNVITLDSNKICLDGMSFNLGEDANLTFGAYLGTRHNIYVDNRINAYGNKVYRYPQTLVPSGFSSSRIPWLYTNLLDLRTTIDNILEPQRYSCTLPLDTDMVSLQSYEVNNVCGILCNGESNSPSCVQTVIRGISSYMLDGTEIVLYTGNPKLEGVNVKISKDDNRGYLSTGDQCLPSKSAGVCTAQDTSMLLDLDVAYDVSSDISEDSNLMLAVIGEDGSFDNHVGGYNIRVSKDCIYGEGRKLYMYIGDDAPDLYPGDEGTYEVMRSDEDGVTVPFILNDPERGNPPTRGRLFFGIEGLREGISDVKGNLYSVETSLNILNEGISLWLLNLQNVILNILYGDTINLSAQGINLEGSEGSVGRMFNSMLSSRFATMVRLLGIIFISFSAISYIFGLTDRSAADVIQRIVKLAFVLGVTDPRLSEFLTQTIIGVFVISSQQLAELFSAQTGNMNPFSFLDDFMKVVLSSETLLRIISLIPSGIVGIVFFVVIAQGFVTLLSASFSAVLIYFMSLLGMGVLILLSPLFFVSILFQRTRMLFQNWVKMMMMSFLTPIFVFAAITLLMQIMMDSLHRINSFEACSQCWIHIELTSFISFCLLRALMPVTYVHDMSFEEQYRFSIENSVNSEAFLGMPFHVTNVLVFWILAHFLKSFVSFAVSMVNSITSTMSDYEHPASMARNAAFSLAGRDQSTVQQLERIKDSTAMGKQGLEFRQRPGASGAANIGKLEREGDELIERADTSGNAGGVTSGDVNVGSRGSGEEIDDGGTSSGDAGVGTSGDVNVGSIRTESDEARDDLSDDLGLEYASEDIVESSTTEVTFENTIVNAEQGGQGSGDDNLAERRDYSDNAVDVEAAFQLDGEAERNPESKESVEKDEDEER